MRREAFMAAAIVGTMSSLGLGQLLTGVSVVPASPSDSDPITLHVTGERISTSWEIDHTAFVQNGNDLTLSLFWASSGAGSPVMLPFTHDESIGVLPEGWYQLTVESIRWLPPAGLADEISTSFMVLPEPTGLFLLLAGGSLALRRQRRR